MLRGCLNPQPLKPWTHLVTDLSRSLVASCSKGSWAVFLVLRCGGKALLQGKVSNTISRSYLTTKTHFI